MPQKQQLLGLLNTRQTKAHKFTSTINRKWTLQTRQQDEEITRQVYRNSKIWCQQGQRRSIHASLYERRIAYQKFHVNSLATTIRRSTLFQLTLHNRSKCKRCGPQWRHTAFMKHLVILRVPPALSRWSEVKLSLGGQDIPQNLVKAAKL